MALTFDDGYAETLELVSALRGHEITSTVFVTSGFVGRPGMLDESGLRALATIPGVEIGAHSVTHPRLDELSVAEIDAELAGSRTYIEQVIGRAVHSFAYPHGAYDRRVRAQTIRQGFHSAAAVKNALTHGLDDPFAIARWLVRASTTPEDLAAVLAGGALPLAWRRERARTVGYRWVRRARRGLTDRYLARADR